MVAVPNMEMAAQLFIHSKPSGVLIIPNLEAKADANKGTNILNPQQADKPMPIHILIKISNFIFFYLINQFTYHKLKTKLQNKFNK